MDPPAPKTPTNGGPVALHACEISPLTCPQQAILYGEAGVVSLDLELWGVVSLDLELLKQLRVSAVASDSIKHSGAANGVWLEYAYSKHHPDTCQLSSLSG